MTDRFNKTLADEMEEMTDPCTMDEIYSGSKLGDLFVMMNSIIFGTKKDAKVYEPMQQAESMEKLYFKQKERHRTSPSG